MAAAHAFQVFRLGFLAGGEWSAMGIPAVPLAELYGESAWSRLPQVAIRTRTPVESVADGVLLNGGERRRPDAVVLAVPWDRASAMAPQLGLQFDGWEHSPITGIHLWFDRAVTDLPHATLLDRTIQWMFNKDSGRHIQLVVSASRCLSEMPRGEVIELALNDLAEFLPATSQARVERAHVVKEIRATFSAKPGLESQRPEAKTSDPNLFLAGDWTRSGWPATMEGAVRRAVDLVCEQQVVEHRAALELERSVLGPVDLGAGHVARQQVRRELDAVEVAHHGAGKFLDCARLGETGCALDEQVTAAQERHHQPFEQHLLTDDALAQPSCDVADLLLRPAGDSVHVHPKVEEAVL
jgi:hypothetical protein